MLAVLLFQNSSLEDGRDTTFGLFNFALEAGLQVTEFGQVLAIVGLLDVDLGSAALRQTGEGNILVHHLAIGNL